MFVKSRIVQHSSLSHHTQALSRWMRESKTASHFVKYMVSNLSVNQSQLQDQVKQISRAVAALTADLQGNMEEQSFKISSPSCLSKTKSSKSLNVAFAETLQTAAALPSDTSLPTLLHRLDDSSGVEEPAAQPAPESRPSMGTIVQLLQDRCVTSSSSCLCLLLSYNCSIYIIIYIYIHTHVMLCYVKWDRIVLYCIIMYYTTLFVLYHTMSCHVI